MWPLAGVNDTFPISLCASCYTLSCVQLETAIEEAWPNYIKSDGHCMIIPSESIFHDIV